MRINFNRPEDVNNTQSSQNMSKNSVKNNLNSQNSRSGLLNQEIITTNIQNYINVQINTLTNLQRNLLLKELLNLPKEWLDLLTTVASKSENTQLKTLQDLLNLQQPVDIELIQTMLSENSKTMVDKLLKLINHTSGNLSGIDQMKSVLAAANIIIPDSNASKQEIIKDILLLYLPFCPIDEKTLKQNFDISEFNDKKASDNETVIFIDTEHLGKFRLSIMINGQNDADINIDNVNMGIDKQYFSNIIEKIKKQLVEINIKHNIALQIKTIEKNKKESRRQFFIQQPGFLSSKTMIIMQLILKIIYGADERISKIK